MKTRLLFTMMIALTAGAGALGACGGDDSSPAPPPGSTADSGSDTATGNDSGGGGSTEYDKVFAIFEAHCTSCHNAGEQDVPGGLVLTPKETAHSNLVGIPGGGSACGIGSGSHTRVVPGDPDGSLLFQKVRSSTRPPCGDRMPKDKPPLDGADIDTIQSWIADGAPQ